MAVTPVLADAASRASLPGGGSVVLPSGYKPTKVGDFNHQEEIKALIAYRNYRSTAAGTWECDGMIAISRAKSHQNLEAFAQDARAALTTRWAYANLKPGWFGGKWENFPLENLRGENGPELVGELAVHVVGFFGVSDKAARFYAVEHQKGLMVGVWIFDSHGGLQRARKLAQDVANTFAL